MKKIHNSKHIYTTILVLLLAFTSCNNDDFFSLEAPPTTEWKTISDMEFGIGFAYNLTLYQNWNTMFANMSFIHFGMSDISRQLQVNGGWGSDILYNRGTDQRHDKVKKWGIGYQTILYCNNMLDFIERDPFPNATESDRINNINRIKGEALFLRAFAYHNLVTWYCPAYDPNGANDSKLMSLRLTAPTNVEAALDNAPVETSVIYDQIVEDFKEAKELLPLKWGPGMHDAYKMGRATKHAAGALLARTLMLMGRYDEALTELNQVLDDSSMPRTLEDDPLANWSNNNATEPWQSPEIIWYAQYADQTRVNTRHRVQVHYFDNVIFPKSSDWRDWWIWALNTETTKRCGMQAEDNSVPESWANDKRSDLFHRFEGFNEELPSTTKYNYTWLVNGNMKGFVGKDDPVYMCKKYHRVPLPENVATEPDQNWPIIRSAELYLWRAALKQVTGKSGYADDLNTIRERAWNESVSGEYQPLTDAETTWDLIDQEWVKEMAFEGDRIIWLQMFKKPIGPGDRGVPDVNPPYPNFYWLVPLLETDFYQN